MEIAVFLSHSNISRLDRAGNIEMIWVYATDFYLFDPKDIFCDKVTLFKNYSGQRISLS
jgi:hypothetical protein